MEIDPQEIENEFDMKAIFIQLLENSMLDYKQVKQAIIETAEYYNMDTTSLLPTEDNT